MKDKEEVVQVSEVEYADNCKPEAEKWNPGKEAGMQGRRCMQCCTTLCLQVGTPTFVILLAVMHHALARIHTYA